MNQWLATLIVLGAFGCLMVAGIRLRERGWHPEWTRKLLHVGMGTVAVSFPWIFSDLLPVVLLCSGFIVLFVALRTVPAMQAAKAVMGSVGRSSLGEIYFAISVALLFVLTDGERLPYVASLLIVTFADAASALVGSHFGQHQYQGADGRKSWEGSAAFVFVAFTCVWIPLSLWSATSFWQNLIIAACVALLTMFIESSAWRGIDNLAIPLTTFAMLRIYDGQSIAVLLQQLVVLSGLAGVFLWCRKRVLLHEGVLLGAMLVTYLGWALGGWQWLVAPLATLVVPPLLMTCSDERQTHLALLSIGVPPVIWLIGSSLEDNSALFSAYTVAYASQLAMTGVALHRRIGGEYNRLRICVRAGVIAWVLLLLPSILLRATADLSISTAAYGLPLLTGMALVFARFEDCYPRQDHPDMYWMGRSLLAFAGSLAFARA